MPIAVDNPNMFDIDSIKQRVEKTIVGIKKMSERELRDVYSRALSLESVIRSELVTLRQRAANLATDTETYAEEAIIEVKGELNKVLTWISEIEGKLSGKIQDHNTASNFGDSKKK